MEHEQHNIEDLEYRFLSYACKLINEHNADWVKWTAEADKGHSELDEVTTRLVKSGASPDDLALFARNISAQLAAGIFYYMDDFMADNGGKLLGDASLSWGMGVFADTDTPEERCVGRFNACHELIWEFMETGEAPQL